MSPVAYNYKKGVDLPTWAWLPFYQTAATQPGVSNAYDGTRFIYWIIQTGSASAASTTQLWRYDTWVQGWQFLLSYPTNLFTGVDLEFDSVRNVLWIAEGNNTTVWRFYNCGTAAVTLVGQTVQPFAISGAIATALPAAATTGASISMTDDTAVAYPTPITPTGGTASTVTTGSTASSINDTGASEFHAGMIGSYLRFTSGALSGQKRVITAVPNVDNLTVTAFGSAPAVGDAYVIELPGGDGTVGAALLTASGGTTTTLVDTETWPTNAYRDFDVIIVGGTGAGQRRRIASNDGTTLTLAGATAGNARTGPFATAPDATSTYRIVPSSDFLYLFVGTTTFYRIDLLATVLAWSSFATVPAAPGAGSNSFYPASWSPQSMIVFRGGATSNVYRYHVGLQTWTTLPAVWSGEVLSTGGAVARVVGRGRFLVHIGGTLRMYVYNPITGEIQPVPGLPYAVPTALEGKRLRWIRTPDGAEFIYFQRAGGQEFFRLAADWL